MRYYIHSTMPLHGDGVMHSVFINSATGGWSSEYPNAFLWDTKAKAEKALAKMRTQLQGATPTFKRAEVLGEDE